MSVPVDDRRTLRHGPLPITEDREVGPVLHQDVLSNVEKVSDELTRVPTEDTLLVEPGTHEASNPMGMTRQTNKVGALVFCFSMHLCYSRSARPGGMPP